MAVERAGFTIKLRGPFRTVAAAPPTAWSIRILRTRAARVALSPAARPVYGAFEDNR